jgi:hypothetical protein
MRIINNVILDEQNELLILTVDGEQRRVDLDRRSAVSAVQGCEPEEVLELNWLEDIKPLLVGKVTYETMLQARDWWMSESNFSNFVKQ